VAEQIVMSKMRDILGAQAPGRAPTFKHPAPEYVRFQDPPVVEEAGPVALSRGEKWDCRIKYFDYGVVSVEMELPFQTDWEGLVRFSARWIGEPEIESVSAELLRGRLKRFQPALVQPYSSWLSEDYCVVQVNRAVDSSGAPLTAKAMLAEFGDQMVRIIRGESVELSDMEREEALQSRLSYYPEDLLVAGWTAAFLYDTPEGAAASRQLLEYANTQLLEFRHYDEALTRVLQNVYKQLDRPHGLLSGWRMGREAERLNAMRLEVIELSERSDNAIKFLSDMFYARAYRLASQKVGVGDYRNLVEQKLRIAGSLYDSMTNQFHQSRAFVLEAMVVAILIIDLILLFRNSF